MGERCIVVGAGPVGLTAALALARQGLEVRIVDAGDGPSVHSKALGVQARTLEVLRSMGCAERLVERGRKIVGTRMYADGELVAHMTFENLDSRYRYLLSVPQAVTERVLIEALSEQADVEVEWETRATAVEQSESTVEVEFADGSTDRADWVLGCDGAHSTVRDTVDSTFEGVSIPSWFILADIELAGNVPSDEASAFLSAQGATGVIPLPGDSQFRLVATLLDQPTDREPEISREILQKLIVDRTLLDAEIVSTDWESAFQVQQRMVDTYRTGRVFLAGDAAHVHSPAGAQGMNTGIQDALNLAWKLGWVSKGLADQKLLDSYDAERRPVAANLLRGTGATTRMMVTENRLLQTIRNRTLAALSSLSTVQERVVRELTMLSVSYRESPIVDQYTDSIWHTEVVSNSETETASVGARIAFQRGPAPGNRAPDGPLEGHDASTMHELISDRHFLAVLFDGRATTDAGYERMSTTHVALAERDAIRPIVVAATGLRPDLLPAEVEVALDPECDLHDRYAAEAECLYLIRPDGYIGYRQQPVDLERLDDFLTAIL